MLELWIKTHWSRDVFVCPFLPPANVVCEGYVFTRICHWFCSQGVGWYPSMQWANPPPRWRTTTLPGWRTPRMENHHPPTPRWRNPPDGEPPPQMETPQRMENPPHGEPSPPDGEPPPLMVTVQAVRILLECILVVQCDSFWHLCAPLWSFPQIHTSFISGEYICLTSVTRAKCTICSALCWKIGNISGSTELFAL